jgi:hypothetical protein
MERVRILKPLGARLGDIGEGSNGNRQLRLGTVDEPEGRGREFSTSDVQLLHHQTTWHQANELLKTFFLKNETFSKL